MHNYSMWGGQFLLQTCPLWCHVFLLHAKNRLAFCKKKGKKKKKSTQEKQMRRMFENKGKKPS